MAATALFDANIGEITAPTKVSSALDEVKSVTSAIHEAKKKQKLARVDSARLRQEAVKAQAPGRLVPTLEEKLAGGNLRRQATEIERRRREQ